MPIIPGIIPIASYAQVRRTCELCDASIPEPLAAALEGLDGDERAEFELGVAYGAQQCAELLAARRPRNPLLRPQPLARHPRHPRGAQAAPPVGGRPPEPA